MKILNPIPSSQLAIIRTNSLRRRKQDFIKAAQLPGTSGILILEFPDSTVLEFKTNNLCRRLEQITNDLLRGSSTNSKLTTIINTGQYATIEQIEQIKVRSR